MTTMNDNCRASQEISKELYDMGVRIDGYWAYLANTKRNSIQLIDRERARCILDFWSTRRPGDLKELGSILVPALCSMRFLRLCLNT